jgi:hypothetical protein
MVPGMHDEIAILRTDAAMAVYGRIAGLLNQYLQAWDRPARERGQGVSAVEP